MNPTIIDKVDDNKYSKKNIKDYLDKKNGKTMFKVTSELGEASSTKVLQI